MFRLQAPPRSIHSSCFSNVFHYVFYSSPFKCITCSFSLPHLCPGVQRRSVVVFHHRTSGGERKKARMEFHLKTGGACQREVEEGAKCREISRHAACCAVWVSRDAAETCWPLHAVTPTWRPAGPPGRRTCCRCRRGCSRWSSAQPRSWNQTHKDKITGVWWEKLHISGDFNNKIK